MWSRSESAYPPFSSIWNGLLPWAPAVAALAACGLLYAFLAASAGPVRVFDARCEPWDDAASAAIARLVAVWDETAEAFWRRCLPLAARTKKLPCRMDRCGAP